MAEVGLNVEVARLNKFDGEGKTKAFVDIAINDSVLIRGLRVVEGKNGVFVGYPRHQGKDGKWYPDIMPLNDEVKQVFNDKILAAYQCA